VTSPKAFLTSALEYARRDFVHGSVSRRAIFVWRALTWPMRALLRDRSMLNRRKSDAFSRSPRVPTNSPGELGLRDAAAGGWFVRDTGELFRGFAIRPEDVVVDVGCGDGGNARFCASLGASTTIVDISANALTRATALLKSEPGVVTAIESDGDPLPLPTEFATRVICTEVLEHVDDPNKFLAELARIGKPGAKYLLSVPDPVAEEIQKHVAPEASFKKPNHIRIIEREEFSSLVTTAGLMVEKRDFQGFFWAMWWTLIWPLKLDIANPRHPLLDNWLNTWNALLDSPDGVKIKELLDHVMPKSQIIIARKP
jgi:ubiquinone/menaquinone biosynthesis C-methylase UbiE